jgi:hypothetical protein
MVTGALLLNFAANFQLLLAPLYAVFASYALFLGRRFWAYSHDSAPLNQQIHSAKQTSHKPASLLQRYEPLKKQTRAWLLHLNFWEFGALSWMPVLWGRDKPFICTPKQANSSTSRSTFIANIRALPKLLLMLNLATLLLVAPFSPLYSPVLFIAALVICLIKVFAASVALDNYRYQRTEGQIINFKTRNQCKAVRKPSKTATSLAKAKAIPSKAMSRHSINKAYTDKEAASS